MPDDLREKWGTPLELDHDTSTAPPYLTTCLEIFEHFLEDPTLPKETRDKLRRQIDATRCYIGHWGTGSKS